MNLPDIPVAKTPLPVRLMTHAESMQSEGWYTTANVLAEAADEIKRLRDALERVVAADWDGWEFRNGAVVHHPHCVAMDALEK